MWAALALQPKHPQNQRPSDVATRRPSLHSSILHATPMRHPANEFGWQPCHQSGTCPGSKNADTSWHVDPMPRPWILPFRPRGGGASEGVSMPLTLLTGSAYLQRLSLPQLELCGEPRTAVERQVHRHMQTTVEGLVLYRCQCMPINTEGTESRSSS